MSQVRKNDVSAMLTTVISALDEGFAKETLFLEGKLWKEADVKQVFQDQLAALQASTAAHATWIKAVTDQREAYKTLVVPLLKALRGYVAAKCGTGSDTYLSFGFAVPQRSKPSSETQLAGVQQGRATRKARSTMGKKQRLAIKGVVSPVTAPAATSPSTPSTSAPSGSNGQSH